VGQHVASIGPLAVDPGTAYTAHYLEADPDGGHEQMLVSDAMFDANPSFSAEDRRCSNHLAEKPRW
jgi:hypothetical protein